MKSFLLNFTKNYTYLLEHCRKEAVKRNMSTTRTILMYIRKGIESEKENDSDPLKPFLDEYDANDPKNHWK